MDTATVTESEMGKTNSKQYTLDGKERRYHITRKDVSEEVKSNRGNSISKPSTPLDTFTIFSCFEGKARLLI